MLTCDIKTAEPFESLFPIGNSVLNEIAKSMDASGYDHVYPVVIWKERNVLVDGHTRLEAAKSAKILDIPVVHKSFADEDEAVEYAIHSQRARRNVTDGDLLRWIGELDRRKTRKEVAKEGRDAQLGLASSEAKPDDSHSRKSAAATADALGISRAKVERARAVMDHAPEETKQEVMENKKTLNRAYTEVREAKKAEEEAAKPKEEKTQKNYRGVAGDWGEFCSIVDDFKEKIARMNELRIEAIYRPGAITSISDLCKKLTDASKNI